MKKLFIVGILAIGTLAATAQTGTGNQKKRTKVKSETTTTDTTSVRTRGLDKGSHQGRTMKNKHRSTKSGGTKQTGHDRHQTDTTTNQ